MIPSTAQRMPENNSERVIEEIRRCTEENIDCCLTARPEAIARRPINLDGDQPAQVNKRDGLAAERTLLAWVRTGLAMMGFGFVVARFGLFLNEIAAVQGTPSRPISGLSLWIGAALIVLGVVVNLLAALQHVRLLGHLLRGEPYRPSMWSLGVVVTLLLAGFGVVMAVYLFVSSP